jgi:myosin heavy subunit
MQGKDDLLELGDFNEGSLLQNIRVRHSKLNIYCSIGSPILIALNPYKRLDIYNSENANIHRKYV